MFKIHWNKKNTTEAIYACAVLAIALTGISLVVHIRVVYAAIRAFLRVISPIVYGLSLAYIINPLLKLIERRVISPIQPKKFRLSPALRRILSLVISYLIVALLLFLIGLLIFPQIVKNYGVIVDSTSDFIQSTILKIGNSFGMDPEKLIERVGEHSASFLSLLGRIGGEFALWLLLFLIGIFISFFVLLHKEHLQASVKKLLAAILKPKRFNSTMRVARLADRTFGRFFIGKIFDSLIIGVISFVVFWIFRMPYYPLLAAVICITNIIPYFGPIIGAVPCVILVLTESPVKAVWIAVIILIIQQVDGNIIGPKIVGNALGIKSLWVVISITIMGSFFGFVGMLIGAPLFSVLYTIVKEHTEKRLAKRNLPTETTAYADLNPLTVFEESVGMTEEHFTETMEAALPAKSDSTPESEPEPSDDATTGHVPATEEVATPAVYADAEEVVAPSTADGGTDDVAPPAADEGTEEVATPAADPGTEEIIPAKEDLASAPPTEDKTEGEG